MAIASCSFNFRDYVKMYKIRILIYPFYGISKLALIHIILVYCPKTDSTMAIYLNQFLGGLCVTNLPIGLCPMSLKILV